MTHFPENPSPSSNSEQDQSNSSKEIDSDLNWVDMGDEQVPFPSSTTPQSSGGEALVMVETAFLASAASLIWLINFYFPPGPLLRLLFPIPVALVYLRQGHRACWMSALISGLLLSLLMGPTRSILYVIPYALQGVQLGACWHRGTSWWISILLGTIIGTFGVFFRFGVLSILSGQDLWVYVTSQIAQLVEWGFTQLGLLTQPSLGLIQALAFVAIVVQSLFYMFTVHLVAFLILNRLGNPIPSPPDMIQRIVKID